MKRIMSLLAVIPLAACMGTSNDGYNVKDVWEKDGVLHARADATEKTESLCFNKARMYARDKVSNYIVNGYTGTDTLKINDTKEQYSSVRENKTESLMHKTQYLIKPYDKKTHTCGVELVLPLDEAKALLGEEE